MPQALLHPGVYIEEVPSGVRTITGVATSVAAFVGFTPQGPVNAAERVFSFADFERQFGGLHLDSPLSYAVSHFFMNGGGTAWIVRVAAGAVKASVVLKNGAGNAVLTATALSEGAWGNGLQLTVDYDTSNPGSLFNLNVAEVQDKGGVRQVVRSETHRNLSMNSLGSNYAVDVVNAGSNLVRLSPSPVVFTAADKGAAQSGPITAADIALLGDNARSLAISVNGGPTSEVAFLPAGPFTPNANFGTAATNLATAIQTEVLALGPAFANFTCTASSPSGSSPSTVILTATSGAGGEKSSISITNASQSNAAGILKLGLANGGREAAAAAKFRPAQSGTAWNRDGTLDMSTITPLPVKTTVQLRDSTTSLGAAIALTLSTTALPSREALRAALETKLRGADPRPEFAAARVLLVDDGIVAIPGGDNPAANFVFTVGPLGTGGAIVSSVNAVPNLAGYRLGVGPTGLAQTGAVPGSDGTSAVMPADISGSQAAKTGLYALEDVDLFNILMLPGQSDASLQAEAVAYAKKRRAFVLLDMPESVDTLAEATAWVSAGSTPHEPNCAAYFPRILFADPLREGRVISGSNVGVIAGLFARTDSERGVWKAPAGTEARLNGVPGLAYTLTDAENGAINPLGLNALRTFPVYGNIAWGARTLVGADVQASEWKYIPIRRLALFLEESLYRGTQWVVFEPNDEPLWAQIRLNIGAFLQGLFRQGAFQGKTPKEAYFVKCDRETTTQADINLGIVNILVGFAPLKPAEFVVIKIQQIAGDIPT